MVKAERDWNPPPSRRLFHEGGIMNELGLKINADIHDRLGDFFNQWAAAGIDIADLSLIANQAMDGKVAGGRVQAMGRAVKRDKSIDKE